MKPHRILFPLLLAFLAICSSFVFAQSETPTDSVMELPAGCTAQSNLVYKTAGDWKGCLDLYLPADTSAPVPLVIMFHGGGFNHGRKEDVQRGALTFLKFGWAVANVEYRLLGVASAPAAVEDARCALLWLVDHAGTYKLDPERIVTTGGSAGGHLALMTGLLPAGNQFDKDCPQGKHYTVVAIVNKYGITDAVEELNRSHYFDGVPDKEKLAVAFSPLTYIRTGVPPIITIHGDEDPRVPYNQAVRLHHLLDSVKVKNVLYTVKGGKHGKFEKDENTKFSQMAKQFLIEIGLPTKKH